MADTVWVSFADQWDPRSPWYDRRVRVAANHAIHRQAISQAEYLGFSKTTWSIIPSSFDLYWQPPGYPYDPAKARQLLAEAGYPNGFDAGEYFCETAFSTIGCKIKLGTCARYNSRGTSTLNCSRSANRTF